MAALEHTGIVAADSLFFVITVVMSLVFAYRVDRADPAKCGWRLVPVGSLFWRTLVVGAGVSGCVLLAQGPRFPGLRGLTAACAVGAAAMGVLCSQRHRERGHGYSSAQESIWLGVMSALLGVCAVVGPRAAVTLVPWTLGYLAGPVVFTSAPVAAGYTLCLSLLAPLWYLEPSLIPDWMVRTLLAVPWIVRLVAAVGLVICWCIGARKCLADARREGDEAAKSFLRQLATEKGGGTTMG